MAVEHGYLILFVFLTVVSYSQGLQASLDTVSDGDYCGRLNCSGVADNNTISVVGLSVFDVTLPNSPVKIASVSVFTPGSCLREHETYVRIVSVSVSSDQAALILGLRETSYCCKTSFLCQLEVVDRSDKPKVIQETVSPGFNCSQLRISCSKGAPHINAREMYLLWGNVSTLCDTETDGGGWIVIQRRTKGDVDFYRGWNDYKNGFGTPDTDFWIGNDVIHNLTSQGKTELRFDVEYQGKQYYAHYSDFTVGNESSSYRLSVSGYGGNVGYDSFRHNNGSEFSTYDRDSINKCASQYHGAWWYNLCTNINLNGEWAAQNQTGLFVYGIVYPGSVDVSEMKVRHV